MEYVGVDVAKETLEVADVSGSRGRSFANREAGIQEFLSWLPHAFPEGEVRLIMEPTSTYHHLLVHALAAQDLVYTLINPANTAAFSQVQGKRAKTDPVDARLLASFGESRQPKPTPPPEEHQEGLKALRRHLVWLEKELQAARNRLDTASFSPWTPQEVLDSLERTIQQLEEEIKLVRAGMASQQEQNQEWTRQMELLTTIPGVGEQTARLLLTELPPVARCPSARTSAVRERALQSAVPQGNSPGASRPVLARGQRLTLESSGESLGGTPARTGANWSSAHCSCHAQAAAPLLRRPQKWSALRSFFASGCLKWLTNNTASEERSDEESGLGFRK